VALLTRDAKVDAMQRVPLFARCSKRELRELARAADEIMVPAGRKLTREGASGREFIVLIAGAADVRRNGRRLRTLGPGDFLGEIALLTGAPRTATVTTTAESRLLVLTDRAFKEARRRLPSVDSSLLQALAERLPPDA
jgi:CRP/FNR family cyclic AMP-dependent transcriptional regulator